MPAVMALEAAAGHAGHEGCWWGDKPRSKAALAFLTALAAAGPGLAGSLQALGVHERAQGWRGRWVGGSGPCIFLAWLTCLFACSLQTSLCAFCCRSSAYLASPQLPVFSSAGFLACQTVPSPSC